MALTKRGQCLFEQPDSEARTFADLNKTSKVLETLEV